MTWLLALGLVGAGPCACAPTSDQTQLFVRVHGLPPTAQQLRVQTRINGLCMVDAWVRQRSDYLRLPVDTRVRADGPLTVRVSVDAVDRAGDENCIIARGVSQVTEYHSGDAFVLLEAPLQPLARPECTLTLSTAGDGRGSFHFEQPGRQSAPGCVETVDCGGDCRQYFEVQAPIQVSARPAGRSYLWAWSEPTCAGLSCQVTLAGEPRRLGVTLALKHCTKDGWCWDHPLPQGNNLNGLAVIEPADDGERNAIAVGDAGTLLHDDGVAWIPQQQVGGQSSLRAIACDGRERCWVVGDDATLLCGSYRAAERRWQWSGCASETLFQEPRPTFFALSWQRDEAGETLLAVGDGGRVMRWEPTAMGPQWRLPERIPGAAALRAVVSVSSAEHYAADETGQIFQKVRGGPWTRVRSGDGRAVNALARGAGNAVWAAGGQGLLLKFQPPSTNFTPMVADLPKETFFAVATHGDQVLLGGTAGVYAVSDQSLDLRALDQAVFAIAAGRDGFHLAGRSGALYRPQGAGYRALTRQLTDDTLVGVFARAAASGPPQVFAVSMGGQVLSAQGGAGLALARGGCGPGVTALFGDRDALWVTTSGGALRALQGDVAALRCEEILTGQPPLNAGSADEQGGAAVGDGGALLERRGATWGPVARPVDKRLRAVWTLPGQEVWAAGEDGAIMHRPRGAGTWDVRTISGAGELRGVFSTAREGGDDLAVAISGTQGIFRRQAGDTRDNPLPWRAVTECGVARGLNALWGSAEGMVTIAGAYGALWQLDDARCLPQRSGAGVHLRGVAGLAGSEQRWLVGEQGAVLSLQP